MKKLVLIILLFSIGCNDRECNELEGYSSIGTVDKLDIGSLVGTYKVSRLSTDHSLNSDSISQSRLYIKSNSLAQSELQGDFYFNAFPVWINALKRTRLENVYGKWTIHTQPGRMFQDDKIVFSPSYNGNNDEIGKSIMAAFEIKISDNKPLLIVRVLTNFNIDPNAGDVMIYPSSESRDYCNYLVYERISADSVAM